VREFATSEDNADKRCHYSSDDVSRRLVHTATPDTTRLSCRCRVRLGGVNWIPTDNSRLSPTENNLKSERVESNRPTHTRHDTDRTVLSCMARRESGGAVRPLDALRRRTHLSGYRADSVHTATSEDKTVAPACRPPPPP